jgi:hypothetical protein
LALRALHALLGPGLADSIIQVILSSMTPLRVFILLLFSVSVFAQDRMVKITAQVKRGGSPNYIQTFMVLATDTANRMGLSVAVRPGEVSGDRRIMYVDVTGPLDKIDEFSGKLKNQSGVMKLQKAGDEKPSDDSYVDGETRKYKVIGTGKDLGSLLNAIKSVAGNSRVTFMDATPNVGGKSKFVTIQVKGQPANLENFLSKLEVAKGVAEVEALPAEVKDNK